MPDQRKKLLSESETQTTEVPATKDKHPLEVKFNKPRKSLVHHSKSDYVVGLWFLLTSGCIIMALMIGGYIRLTESDLAMVDYAPIRNMKPPFNKNEWKQEFEKYQQYPDYPVRHANITMNDFKFMYRLNYVHRMGARFIGLLFFIPMIIFWIKGYFNKETKIKSIIISCLLLFQAFMGWFMLQSGLEKNDKNKPEEVRPCQYRVVTHFIVAVLLYSLCLHSGLNHLLRPDDHSKVSKIKKLRALSCATKAVIFVSLIFGSFVAAIDASQIHNDWPKYSGFWLPENMFEKSPWFLNFFENPGTVQFTHRHMGYLTVFMVTVLFIFSHRLKLSTAARISLILLLVFTYLQAFMGIMTLVFKAPIWLAAFHQHGGLGLLTFNILFSHEIKEVPHSP